MDSAAERLDDLCKLGCVGNCDEWLLCAQVLCIFQRYWLSSLCFLSKILIEGLMFGVRLETTGCEEEILIEIFEIEGSDGCLGILGRSNEKDWGVRLDKKL